MKNMIDDWWEYKKMKNMIDDWLEKPDELLDKDLEKKIKEYESSDKPIYARLFFFDEYGNPIPPKNGR